MKLTVVGGGLAGCEAAWQAASMGVEVRLVEMRPRLKSGVHHTDLLGEMVCTDFLGPAEHPRNPHETSLAQTLLRDELRVMGSLLMECADQTRVPGKPYFAFDKRRFGKMLTERISRHPKITVVREECGEIPDGPTVIATGPLTSRRMAASIAAAVGEDQYFGFEASAPLIHGHTIDRARVVETHDEKGNLDILACPLSPSEFDSFFTALAGGDRAKPHVVEQIYISDVRIPNLSCFDREGGKAIEDHSREDLLKSVLTPDVSTHTATTGRPASKALQAKSMAAVRLIPDSENPNLYNSPAFKPGSGHGEQKRIFRMIPGLEQAEFVRYGHIHLSCYLNAGQLLPTLQYKNRNDLFFAGELAGTDTYLAAIGTGWVAGQNAARFLVGKGQLILPPTTMYGALCGYLAWASPQTFQPMVPNLFLLRPCPAVQDLERPEIIEGFAETSLRDLKEYLTED